MVVKMRNVHEMFARGMRHAKSFWREAVRLEDYGRINGAIRDVERVLRHTV
jgi:hypothetical protein